MPLTPPPPSWANVRNKPTTVAGLGVSDFNASVLNANANASEGAVGTYVLARYTASPTGTFLFGTTTAGSNLQPSNTSGANLSASLSGTWLCMGTYRESSSADTEVTLHLRIS